MANTLAMRWLLFAVGFLALQSAYAAEDDDENKDDEITFEPQTKWCSVIDPYEAYGADGWFAMELANGQGNYAFDIDLTDFEDLETYCPTYASTGFTYAIHTAWGNISSNSTAYPSGCAMIGGHYDPNFACSPDSSQYPAECFTLRRTLGFGYVYTCNATLYEKGRYAVCELGDLSGKFGYVALQENDDNEDNDKKQIQVSSLVDYQPPYPAYYNRAGKDSPQWISWALRCASNNNVLICGKFTGDLSSDCEDAIESMTATSNTGDTNDDIDQNQYDAAVATAAIVCFFGGLAIGMGIIYGVYGRKSSELTRPINQP